MHMSKWLPGAITKDSMNTKMTISKDPLVKIDTSLVPKCFLYETFDFSQFGIPRIPPFANTKNSAEHENDNISKTA